MAEPFEMPIYPGKCEFTAAKGPEYLAVNETFDIASGETVKKKFSIRRFADLSARGWHSGDDHCHIGRSPARDENILDLLCAVDLDMTNIVQMGDEHRLYFVQSVWGKPSHASRGSHWMAAGQEAPRTKWRGHTLAYNLQNGIHNRETYYLYEDAFKEARAQGGITGYAHNAWAYQGEMAMTVSAALGLVDFVEVGNADLISTDGMYHFWNLGYRLSIAAGSDFPWGGVPGVPRFYTYVDGEFSVEKYMEALKAGHTFNSKGGAFIDARANGHLPGSQIEASPGDKITIRFSGTVNPEFDEFDRAEIVKNGAVVETIEPVGSPGGWLEHESTFVIDESCWFAVRCYGKKSAYRQAYKCDIHTSSAHTTPFFVTVDGKPILNKERFKVEMERAKASIAKFRSHIADPKPPIDLELMAKQKDRLLDYVNQAEENLDALKAE